MARTLAMFVNSLRPKKIAIYGAAMFITANINKATARLYDAIVPKSFLSQSDLRISPSLNPASLRLMTIVVNMASIATKP